MSAISQENIKELLASFDMALAIHENEAWAKSATSQDIKISFKQSLFVESAIENLQQKKCLGSFLEILTEWRKSKNQSFTYSEEFYSKMCDHLLLSFFQTPNLSEHIIDIAVRMYTSLLPKERLENCLKHFILSCGSIEALKHFAQVSSVDDLEIRSRSILSEWTKRFNAGGQNEIETIIKDSLSNFKLEQSLPCLVQILALNIESPVVKTILDNLLHKMTDRSILSKDFWLLLLRKLSREHLGRVCTNHECFLESLCNFLIYIGSMMELDAQGDWSNSSDTCFCYEITYEELETMIKFLAGLNSNVKVYVKGRLVEAKSSTGCVIWDQILEKCLQSNFIRLPVD